MNLDPTDDEIRSLQQMVSFEIGGNALNYIFSSYQCIKKLKLSYIKIYNVVFWNYNKLSIFTNQKLYNTKVRKYETKTT